MRRIVIALVILASLVVATGMAAGSFTGQRAWAEEWVASAADGSGEPTAQAIGPPDLRRRLSLTEDQARRVEQILMAHRTRTARLRIDLARARLDTREALLEATVDRARLEALARRTADVQAQLIRARFDLVIELRQVLTQEQWMRLQMTRPGRGLFRRQR